MGARSQRPTVSTPRFTRHMTNTLNTPVEAIEREYPLRVERYAIVPRTGGDGRYRGGCGLVRALTLTSGTATFGLFAERHVLAPPGAAGGADGATGRHALVRGGVERAARLGQNHRAGASRRNDRRADARRRRLRRSGAARAGGACARDRCRTGSSERRRPAGKRPGGGKRQPRANVRARIGAARGPYARSPLVRRRSNVCARAGARFCPDRGSRLGAAPK